MTDVMRWLDTLALGQYKQAFKEASVDGEFLLELREEDLMQVLGMEHKLHVRKVILARDKLKPLDQREAMQKAAVITESKAQAERDGGAIPDLDTVFSQARNGRIKRLEDSLNAEFPLDSEDEKGNTLLLVACQQCNHKMAEMLLARGANINHQNAHGNSPLHFAMAYDTEGAFGEHPIQKGADYPPHARRRYDAVRRHWRGGIARHSIRFLSRHRYHRRASSSFWLPRYATSSPGWLPCDAGGRGFRGRGPGLYGCR